MVTCSLVTMSQTVLERIGRNVVEVKMMDVLTQFVAFVDCDDGPEMMLPYWEAEMGGFQVICVPLLLLIPGCSRMSTFMLNGLRSFTSASLHWLRGLSMMRISSIA